jgi:hypothetical protein
VLSDLHIITLAGTPPVSVRTQSVRIVRVQGLEQTKRGKVIVSYPAGITNILGVNQRPCSPLVMVGIVAAAVLVGVRVRYNGGLEQDQQGAQIPVGIDASSLLLVVAYVVVVVVSGVAYVGLIGDIRVKGDGGVGCYELGVNSRRMVQS